MHVITEFLDFPTLFQDAIDEAEEIKEEEIHIEENPTESRGTGITLYAFLYYIMFML